jgi:hypothetical protein
MTTDPYSTWNPFRRHALGGVVQEVDQVGVQGPGSAGKSKTWETKVERVESWPEEARVLKRRTWLSYLFAFGDVLVVLLPVYFICEY